jgi:hypothetical protein
MQGTAFILIRSVVANPGDRQLFDHWYQTDHISIIFSKIASVNQAGDGGPMNIQKRAGSQEIRQIL